VCAHIGYLNLNLNTIKKYNDEEVTCPFMIFIKIVICLKKILCIYVGNNIISPEEIEATEIHLRN
jgi:hypothetical protein